MMTWTRTKTLIAGIALIVAANAAALFGVAYNRSGEPDSTLRLSQRELHIPYGWRVGSENTGIALNLRWRVLVKDTEATRGYDHGNYGSPSWLDEAKLASLGFDVPTDKKSVHARQLTREVLLVLELDGPARELMLARARHQLMKEETLLAANAGKKEFENRVKSAKTNLENEESKNSRLFAVDAGHEIEALRALYPDRTRYAIVHGKVQPRVVKQNNVEHLVGYISGLMVSQINVPLEFQQAIGQRPQGGKHEAEQRVYAFDVAFGKKLEPWIVAESISK